MHRYEYLKNICFQGRQSPEVIFRTEKDDKKLFYILYNSLSGEAYVIKETNKKVWEMLDGKTSLQIIIERLYSHYNNKVDKIKLVIDVIEFLKFLWERNFIFKAFIIPDYIEIKDLDCYG